MMWNRSDCLALARQHGYRVERDQKNSNLLIVVKGSVQVNVHYGKRTVLTSLPHPIKGKTQLVRRYVTLDMLDQILANPRIHTGRGYYG